MAQAAYAAQAPSQTSSSPFTHAPLANRSSATNSPAVPSPPTSQASKTTTSSYGSYSYGYPGYPSYPGYPPHPHATPSASTLTSSTNAAKPPETEKHPAESDTPSVVDSGDAWEAAQHILKAINFGSLQPQAAESTSASAQPPPAPITASGLDILSSIGASVSTESAPSRAGLTDEERASLQAQLALLAAQLSEIAELDDDEGNATDEEDLQASSSVIESHSVQAGMPFQLPLPPELSEENEDDDDDMEMVEVPTLPIEIRS